MSDIERMRSEIDLINRDILELLEKRACLALKIGDEKRKQGIDIFDPIRESVQAAGLAALNKGPFSDEAVKRIFGVIFAESRNLQSEMGSLSVSRKPDSKDTAISLGKGKLIGGDGRPAVIAGPCSVESLEQMMNSAACLSKYGVFILRGGAFKPRTSPYSFQGLGIEGLKILRKAADEYGMLCVSEATSEGNIDAVADYCDIVQIGARNMYNYALLEKAGRIGRPVLLKRHFAATIKEFMLSAEYLLKSGNSNVILCERGIRTFENSTRSTLDISAIPLLRRETSLPIIADISHSAGRKDISAPLAAAALAAGAAAIMVEVHPCPQAAFSDGGQQLDFNDFGELIKKLAPFIS